MQHGAWMNVTVDMIFHSSVIIQTSIETAASVMVARSREAMERWSAGGARRFMQVVAALCLFVGGTLAADPVPKPWPLQFHAQMYQNRTGKLSMIDLWYDFPNGRNLNLIQNQLGGVTHDVEYTNGTSYYYDLEAGTCRDVHFSVGVLRPDWLSDATYVGVQDIDNFKCHVWEKADFIRYYEDIETKRPVSWYFTESGMDLHIMTFEEGNVLEDRKWQAPAYCFQKAASKSRSNQKLCLGLLSNRNIGGRKDLKA